VTSRYVLVTGGAGYIGSHTCKALAEKGYVPVTYDNLSTGKLSSVKWGPFIQGDLLDENKINETLALYDFSGVIHFAAKAYVGESVSNPLKYFEGNISTTINLLKSIHASKISAIVFSSSCAVYGEPVIDKISESLDPNPINPYGYTKNVCEKLIESVSAVTPLNYALLRYFNAAGADMEGEIGETHDPETHIIPLALKAALTETLFTVFGGDFKTRDGSAVRDYIHVSDLAEAHVRALERILNGGDSFVCNLGTGEGISVLEVMKEIGLMFPNFKYSIGPKRLGDPAHLVADPSLSKEILDFAPKNSDLQKILQSALNWHLSTIEGKRPR
jgi:UDP-arabinose 4-epimerase